jgi:hypothetical protein
MWALIALVSAVASLAGYSAFQHASPDSVAFMLAFAGGAILTMLSDTMMPEAYEHGGKLVGVVTALGFAFAFLIDQLDRERPLTSARRSRLRLVIGEELRRLVTWSERHRRLLARVLLTVAATIAFDLVAALLAWDFESGVKGSEIHGFGDALFFATVQLLTVSSQLKNPVTTAGRVLDVALEAWAIFVVTAVAGSFAAFFQTGDSS